MITFGEKIKHLRNKNQHKSSLALHSAFPKTALISVSLNTNPGKGSLRKIFCGKWLKYLISLWKYLLFGADRKR